MRRWCMFSGIALFLVFLSDDLRSETYRFAVAENTIDTVVSEVLIRKAYAMLGHQVSIVPLPPKRALVDANSGIYDGDVQRIFSVAHTYPNLIRVEPAINYIYGTGFIRKGSRINVSSWESLQHYKVGIILGIRFAETNVPKKNALTFYSYQELTEAVINGKIDIGIYPQSNGIYQSLLLGKSGIVPLTNPLAKFELFHYIHKKNKHLAPDLSRIFSKFAQDGTLEKVRERVLDISFTRAKEGLKPCLGDYACYDSVWEN